MERMKRIRCNSDGSFVIKNIDNQLTVIGRSNAMIHHQFEAQNDRQEGVQNHDSDEILAYLIDHQETEI